MLTLSFANPILRGALSGLVAAATVDIHAFLTWKDPTDAKAYNWRLAVLRWAQGTVTGALTGAGFGAIS